MIVESYEDTIILSGALRHNFWETVHTAISLTLKRHPTGVIIDCSGITECTMDGVETFRDIMAFTERFEDARVIVAALPPHVREVIRQVPEVRSQLPIAETVEEARRSLDLFLVEHDRSKRRAAGPADRRILVCLSGTPSDDHMLQVIVELSDNRSTAVCLLYPVLVPRDLPIQAPLSEEEEEAARVLGAASRRMEAVNVDTTMRMERARDLVSAIEDTVDEIPVDEVYVALPVDTNAADSALKLIRALLGKIAKPLHFIRADG